MLLKGLAFVVYTVHSVLTGALGSDLYIPSLISSSGVSKPERLPFEQYAVRHPESKKTVLEALRRHASKDASKDDDRCINFLVIKLVRAIQNAPPKTNNTPTNDTEPPPNGSAEIITPQKPNKIATIRTKLILSLK